jgi:beta-lactamase class A
VLLTSCSDDDEGLETVEADIDGDGRTEEVSPAEAIRVGPVDTTLYGLFRKLEAKTGGRIGVAAIHIESGWRTAWRGGETFPMASVAKLPMALALMRMVDSGRVRLDSVVPLGPEHHRPGPSVVYHRSRRDSVGPTLHRLVDAALTMSDNTACDRLLSVAGGPGAADALMERLGLSDIDISSYEGELILRWSGVDPGLDSGWTRAKMYESMKLAGREAYQRAEAQLVDDTTDAARPEALARLLVLLQQGRILSPAATDTVLSIMSRARTGRGRIPGRLDTNLVIAHKTGSISSVANDVGIVTLPDGTHLAIAVLIKGARVGNGTRDRVIAEIAQAILGASGYRFGANASPTP